MRCRTNSNRLLHLASAGLLATFGAGGLANAADAPNGEVEESATAPRTTPNATPITAYAYTAGGVPVGTVGASATGFAVDGAPSNGAIGGGGTVWASPIDRFTIVADAQRSVTAEFAPSAALIVRIFGVPNQGWSFGALGKFKIDGFARGPNKEVETELESGLLLSYGKKRLHFDLNAVIGFGLGDDGEIDSEARLRLGYDVTSFLRLGIDEQARYRMAGTNNLPGDRVGDLAGGAQALFWWTNFFGALTGGPATYGVSEKRVGAMAIVTLGGVTL